MPEDFKNLNFIYFQHYCLFFAQVQSLATSYLVNIRLAITCGRSICKLHCCSIQLERKYICTLHHECEYKKTALPPPKTTSIIIMARVCVFRKESYLRVCVCVCDVCLFYVCAWCVRSRRAWSTIIHIAIQLFGGAAAAKSKADAIEAKASKDDARSAAGSNFAGASTPYLRLARRARARIHRSVSLRSVSSCSAVSFGATQIRTSRRCRVLLYFTRAVGRRRKTNKTISGVLNLH